MSDMIEDDLENIFGDGTSDREVRQVAQQIAAQPAEATVYPLSLADGTLPGQTAAPTGISRRVGPLPVWGWVLTALGGSAAAYYWYQKREVKKNDGGSEEPAATGGDDQDAGGWSPSRGRFAEMLARFFAKTGLTDKVTIYNDADDAKKAKLKQISPLVTIVMKTTAPMKELEKLARREGLKPTAHEGGVVGFYPITGKRGRAWEQYIDLLRDDGQSV